MGVVSEFFVLSNGVRIPKLGFGTWKIPDEAAPQAVAEALAVGYRHIDTARVYRNERGVGKGLSASGLPREEVFVTTKVPSGLKDPALVGEFIDESLRRLGTDYVDLLLIHGPKPWPPGPDDDSRTYFSENSAVWDEMAKALDRGLLKAIGVSNFEIPDLENLLATSPIAPMVNQIELRIGYPETELVAFCSGHGILVEAYSPLGTGLLLGHPEIVVVADRLGVTVPQLCIRYVLEKGAVPLPKAAHRDHMVANTLVDFAIPADEMAVLDAIRIEPQD